MKKDNPCRNFGKRLKEARTKCCYLTQKELSEKSGVSAMHISQFETEARLPSLQNFARLAVVLKVRMEWLLVGRY